MCFLVTSFNNPENRVYLVDLRDPFDILLDLLNECILYDLLEIPKRFWNGSYNRNLKSNIEQAVQCSAVQWSIECISGHEE